MSEFTALSAMRESRAGIAVATFAATMVAVAANAQGKIINATSSCTPELGVITPPQGAECPVNLVPGSDKPDILAPTHTSKEPGVVDYEIQVPNLGIGTSTKITLQGESKLLAINSLGGKKARATKNNQLPFIGTATSTDGKKYKAENIRFRLSPKAHLGNKVCSTMVISETTSGNGWTLEDDYTDRECTTVGKPLTHYQAAVSVSSYFNGIYKTIKPDFNLNKVKDVVTPKYLHVQGQCDPNNPYNPFNDTFSVTDVPSGVTTTSCVKGQNGKYEFTKTGRKSLLYPSERAHTSNVPYLRILGDKILGSLGMVGDEIGGVESVVNTTSGLVAKFSRGPEIGGATQLKQVSIDYRNHSVHARPF